MISCILMRVSMTEKELRERPEIQKEVLAFIESLQSAEI